MENGQNLLPYNSTMLDHYVRVHDLLLQSTTLRDQEVAQADRNQDLVDAFINKLREQEDKIYENKSATYDSSVGCSTSNSVRNPKAITVFGKKIRLQNIMTK
jgi:hypothetical protein